MGKKIPLGRAVGGKSGIIMDGDSTEERLLKLESQLKAMTHAFYHMRNAAANTGKDSEVETNAYDPGLPIDTVINRDGLPIGITLIGITEHAPFILTVGGDGLYYVNNIPYHSLSSAAKGIGAPLRKSGWKFWKVIDGRSVKDIYRKV